jgi:hypothetical protein
VRWRSKTEKRNYPGGLNNRPAFGSSKLGLAGG